MIKLVALYRKPSETAEFDSHFESIHTPLLRKLPGLKRLETTRVTGAPLGEAKYYRIAEAYFDDRDAMDRALASAEGKAVVKDLLSFASDLVTVFHGEPE